MKLPLSPLLRADPSTLPPYRKGKRGQSGGLFKYIEAVKPGPPPAGWRDITPYFGRKKVDLGTYRLRAEAKGYLLQWQQVTHKGRTYRRIAVALKSHLPVTKRNNPQGVL